MDFDQLELQLTDAQFTQIEEVVDALAPIRAIAEMICRRDATLITADRAFKFALEEITSQASDIAASLSGALIRRIGERRQPVLVGLLKFLDDRSTMTEENDL